MKIDLHHHSSFSSDSSADPEESVIRAIEVGLDGIAFTEHDSYEKSEPVERLRERYASIKIFRGVEYPSESGHVLIFGLRDDSFHQGFYAPLEDIIRVVAERGGVTVIPHPFRGWLFMQADLSSLSGIHAIEGFNGRNSREENYEAVRAALKLGLPTTGGSDAHDLSEIGRCYTLFDGDVNYENFIERLKEGRYRGIDCRIFNNRAVQ